MTRRDLEKLIPGLAERSARERQNRALAFSGITARVCGVEILPITPNTRLELQLVRNACIMGVPPLEGDVFQFLWSLSPSRGKATAAWVRARIKKHVRKLDMDSAAREIAAHVADQLQDMPEQTSEPNTGNVSADYVHWMAAEAGFWMDIHGGFTIESYRRTPYLVLQQLHRAWRCNHPKVVCNRDGSIEYETPYFINMSDRLVGEWQRSQRAHISKIILSQRERLPN